MGSWKIHYSFYSWIGWIFRLMKPVPLTPIHQLIFPSLSGISLSLIDGLALIFCFSAFFYLHYFFVLLLIMFYSTDFLTCILSLTFMLLCWSNVIDPSSGVVNFICASSVLFCLCDSIHNNFWMREQIFMKLGMSIMAPEPVSAANS